jgi:hypothetical protein
MRCYIDGRDLSGFTSEIGPLETSFDEAELLAVQDSVRGVLPNHPHISIGTLNACYDNTATSGLQAVMGGAGVSRDVLVALGIRAAPAEGDPAFMGAWNQLGFQMVPGGAVTATIPFGMWDVASDPNYAKAWGTLLHENTEETAANTSTGVDDKGASSSAGGFLMYQILSVTGTGTVTISVDEADTNENASFAALTDATSGAIAHTAIPCSGIVQLGSTATVKRFIRWQMALNTLTAATFVLGFVRG